MTDEPREDDRPDETPADKPSKAPGKAAVVGDRYSRTVEQAARYERMHGPA